MNRTYLLLSFLALGCGDDRPATHAGDAEGSQSAGGEQAGAGAFDPAMTGHGATEDPSSEAPMPRDCESTPATSWTECTHAAAVLPSGETRCFESEADACQCVCGQRPCSFAESNPPQAQCE
jgi:hypothetical protein